MCYERVGFNRNKLKWIDHVPQSSRQNATLELYTTYKTNLDMVRSGQRQNFDVQFKSCKNKQTIALDGRQFNREYNCMFVDLWKKLIPRKDQQKLRTSEAIPEITTQIQVTYDKGQYHYLIPILLEPRDINSNRRSVCAIDPGERTFATCYDGQQYMEEGISTSSTTAASWIVSLERWPMSSNI